MMGKPAGSRPYLLTTLMPGKARRFTGPLPELLCSRSWLPRHWFPTRSLPSATPMPPIQAPYSSEQGLLGGRGGGWLSQLKLWLKALFLLVPSWQCFCGSVSSKEPATYFAGSSPCLGSLSGTPELLALLLPMFSEEWNPACESSAK